MTGEALRAADPAAAWWLDQIRPDDTDSPSRAHVTPDGTVYARGATVTEVLDAIQAWHDTDPLGPVGLVDVVDALTPDPGEAALIVAAVLDDPVPDGLAERAAEAAQVESRESLWDDRPWSVEVTP